MRFNIDENSDTSTPQNTPTTTLDNTASLESFVKNLNDSVTEMEKMKAEMQKRMQDQFSVLTKHFFTLVPKIKAIAWNQYSPYFNDGDECTFSVHEVYVLSFVPESVDSLDDDYDDEDDYDEDDEDSEKPVETPEEKANRIIIGDYSNSNHELLTPKELSACHAVRQFISNNEDLMHDLYDNHSTIILTASGAQVSDYDHD